MSFRRSFGEGMIRVLLIVITLAAAAVSRGSSLPASNGPVSLVITYRARPETRVDFRRWFMTEGAAQFARWKQDGVFAECLLLFTSFAATTSVDAVVVIDFARYTDSARWKEIEKTFPGGLSPAALRSGAAEAAFYADTLSRAASLTRDPAHSVFLLAFYEVIPSAEKYRSYAEGYIAPQMRGWIEAETLSSYRLLFNHAPLSVVWDAILVLEYKDIAALARRDEVKASVRVKLAQGDATWVAWSKDKSDIRREKALIVCDAIPLPRP
jgi:hypothetical protein